MNHSNCSRTLLALAASISLISCTDTPTSPNSTLATLGPAYNTAAPQPSTAKYEVKFMTDMIDHHQMAIMMAELCVTKAVHEELRTLCQDIIDAQRAEIVKMQSWLREWYGIEYAPEMKPGDTRMMEKMAALPAAEFEIEFMQMMIKHHAKAVKEGEHCLDRAYHAELIELCENIIATQTQEITQMQQWLCAWYGICR